MTEQLNRRAFQQGLGSLILGGSVVSTAPAGGAADPAVEICDFQSSFMTWDLPYRKDSRPYARHKIPYGNMARIQLEALIDVTDQPGAKPERFALIAPCRTEWVYADDKLFQLPSREYRTINSATHERSLTSSITFNGKTYTGRAAADSYRSMKVDVRSFSQARALTSSEEIVQATSENVPLVARTKLQAPSGDRSMVLQYPIRTMNFQPKTNSFQVDTGPLLVPDYASEADLWIDRLEMAHVVYNRLDRAEFILRRPTPVHDDNGKELYQTLYYSDVREEPAETQIFAGQTG